METLYSKHPSWMYLIIVEQLNSINDYDFAKRFTKYYAFRGYYYNTGIPFKYRR